MSSCSDLTDVNLADEDTNQILTDPKQCGNASDPANNSNGAIWWPTLETMQMAPSGSQIWNLYKSLETMQMAPSDGQICKCNTNCAIIISYYNNDVYIKSRQDYVHLGFVQKYY